MLITQAAPVNFKLGYRLQTRESSIRLSDLSLYEKVNLYLCYAVHGIILLHNTSFRC